jgi:hypothetical protein
VDDDVAVAGGGWLVTGNEWADFGFWMGAEPLWRVTSNWWRDDADEDVGVPKWDVIISDV